MEYSIRRAFDADKKDFSAFGEIFREDQIFEMLNNDLYKVFVLEIDDSVVSYAIFFGKDEHLDLISIETLKEYRNQGITKKFLQNILDSFENESIKTITLEVRESNDCAINLYNSLNFVKISTRENYYKDNENALIYQYIYKESDNE